MINSKIKRIIKELRKTSVDQDWLKQSQRQMVNFMDLNPVRKTVAGRQLVSGGIFNKLIFKPMPISIIALIVSLVAGSGVVASSQNSLPTEILYPLKIATEQVQEAMTFNKAKKIDLSVKLAEKRLNEIKQLQKNSEASPVVINETLKKYEKHLTDAQGELASLSSNNVASKTIAAAAKYENSLEKQQEKLTALTNQTSQIDTASRHSFDKAQKAIIANSNQTLEKISIQIQEATASQISGNVNSGVIGGKTEVAPSIVLEKIPEYLAGIEERTKNRINSAGIKAAEIKNRIFELAGQNINKCNSTEASADLAMLEADYQKMEAVLISAQKLFDQKDYLAALNQANQVMALAIDTDNLISQWRSRCSDNQGGPNQPALRMVNTNEKFSLKIQEAVGVEKEDIIITLNEVSNICPASCPSGEPENKCGSACDPKVQLTIGNTRIKGSYLVFLSLNQSELVNRNFSLKLLDIDDEKSATLILNKEPAGCLTPKCLNAYKTGEYDDNKCPIYKCPGKECQAVFSSCDCAYKCVEVFENKSLVDCARNCSLNEINNYKPNCGYQNGLCQDLIITKPCPAIDIICDAGLISVKNGSDKNGCPILSCQPAREEPPKVEINDSISQPPAVQGENSTFKSANP